VRLFISQKTKNFRRGRKKLKRGVGKNNFLRPSRFVLSAAPQGGWFCMPRSAIWRSGAGFIISSNSGFASWIYELNLVR